MKIKIIISLCLIPLNVFLYWIFYSFNELLEDLFSLIFLNAIELLFLFVPRYGGLIESIEFITHEGNKEDEIDSDFDRSLKSKDDSNNPLL